MNFSIIDLGCKVNTYEAESIASLLQQRGYTRVPAEQKADLCLIFTCAVTNTAAQKSRQMMHRVRRLNPTAILVVAGCYAQIDPASLAMADILVGSAHKKQIPDLIEQYLKNKTPIRDLTDLKQIPFENLLSEHFEQTRAYLKIQDGCNQFCSYCIIPYARGRERSMAPDLAVQEAVRVSQQHHEIVLAGIHTGRYGREYGVTLSQLMARMLAAADQLQRLRISSIEMTELDDGFITLMASQPRIARHLHIPLQSGCDSVLKRMNRPYDTAAYYAKIEALRQAIPDLSVSADLIVGFPGETEEEFAATFRFLQQCRFSFLHVFPYSLRNGTRAAAMKEQVPAEIKKQRTEQCLALSQQLYDQYKETWIGRPADVLCEGQTGSSSFGHSSQYLPVSIAGSYERGAMVPVRITGMKDHIMIAERQ